MKIRRSVRCPRFETPYMYLPSLRDIAHPIACLPRKAGGARACGRLPGSCSKAPKAYISLQLEKPLRSFLPCSKLITVQCSETERIMERGRWGVWGFWLEKEGSECGGEGGVTCMEKDGRDSTNLSRWGEKESLGWLEAAFSHRHSQI
ncbi:hypothetical protein B296_00020883 [Ensete ventricosum]|uniref:Uncharacterized protein n=1 Tax=Ensete ventricosum TaxID=4639 RepID=A0A427B0R0_ENSVE|nr:hypothetical protein B296_00020883 [Ensete ventricosum]